MILCLIFIIFLFFCFKFCHFFKKTRKQQKEYDSLAFEILKKENYDNLENENNIIAETDQKVDIFSKFKKYFKMVFIIEIIYIFVLSIFSIIYTHNTNDIGIGTLGLILFIIKYILSSWLCVLIIPFIIRQFKKCAIKKIVAQLYCYIFAFIGFLMVIVQISKGEALAILEILTPIKFIAVYQYMIAGSTEFINKRTKCKTINFDIKKYFKNKKFIYSIFGLILFCLIYQIFFRYEYKIFEGNYNRNYVVKLDKLTGKATQEYVKVKKIKTEKIIFSNEDCNEFKLKMNDKSNIFADIDREIYNKNCK